MPATVGAAALTLSLSLAAPALATGDTAVELHGQGAEGPALQTAEPGNRQLADSGSGVFLDFNHTQTVETKRLKRRRHKR